MLVLDQHSMYNAAGVGCEQLAHRCPDTRTAQLGFLAIERLGQNHVAHTGTAPGIPSRNGSQHWATDTGKAAPACPWPAFAFPGSLQGSDAQILAGHVRHIALPLRYGD